MSDKEVELIVRFHDLSRSDLLQRCFSSVLKEPAVGIVLVLHNLELSQLNFDLPEKVKVVELSGKYGQPGAASNAGLRETTAQWVGILDSDDYYQPGAISTMLSRAKKDRANGIIAPLQKQGKRNRSLLPTLKNSSLSPVKDGLFYQTAPLGLFSRELIAFGEAPFLEQVVTGEDIRVTARMWTAPGARISYYPKDPAYVVCNDAADRTSKPRTIVEMGAAWEEIWQTPFVKRWNQQTRHALAVKIARTHVLDAIRQRPEVKDWNEQDLVWMREYLTRLRSEDPKYDYPLSRSYAMTLHHLEKGKLSDALRSLDAVYAGERPLHYFSVITERESEFRWAQINRVRYWRERLENKLK